MLFFIAKIPIGIIKSELSKLSVESDDNIGFL